MSPLFLLTFLLTPPHPYCVHCNVLFSDINAYVYYVARAVIEPKLAHLSRGKPTNVSENAWLIYTNLVPPVNSWVALSRSGRTSTVREQIWEMEL